MMKLSRRNLLKMVSVGTALPSLSLLPTLLSAETRGMRQDQYFVFAYFSGGWDNMLALDPKDPEIYTPDSVSTTGIQPAYQQITGLNEADFLIPTNLESMTFGPFIGDLQYFADRIAVLRGMTMESVAHQVARRHALTGRRPAGTSVRGSSVATILAYLLGENEPIPNLVAGTESFNINEPLWATGLPTANINDLYSALSPSPSALRPSQRDALTEFFEKQRSRVSHSRESALYENHSIAHALTEQGLADFFDLDSPDLAIAKDQFQVGNGSSSDNGAMALLAAQALTMGISRCVTIKMAGSLDTHQGLAWRNEQGPRQQSGFNAIASLAQFLENTPFGDIAGDNWLNHTTIVCFSEFGRGAKLNGNGGRDHNPINSMLLLGGLVRGGQVIGQTSEIGMLAQPVNLHSGAVDPGGELLGNNHIARTLLHGAGAEDDIGDFRADPILALLED